MLVVELLSLHIQFQVIPSISPSIIYLMRPIATWIYCFAWRWVFHISNLLESVMDGNDIRKSQSWCRYVWARLSASRHFSPMWEFSVIFQGSVELVVRATYALHMGVPSHSCFFRLLLLLFSRSILYSSSPQAFLDTKSAKAEQKTKWHKC